MNDNGSTEAPQTRDCPNTECGKPMELIGEYYAHIGDRGKCQNVRVPKDAGVANRKPQEGHWTDKLCEKCRGKVPPELFPTPQPKPAMSFSGKLERVVLKT